MWESLAIVFGNLGYLDEQVDSMLNERLVFKIICAVGLFFIAQVAVFWMQLQNLDEKKLMLIAEIDTLLRKREELNKKIWMQEKETYRMEEKFQRIDNLLVSIFCFVLFRFKMRILGLGSRMGHFS